MTDSDQANITWHKSTASGANGNCIQVAVVNGSVHARNSRDPHGSILSFTRQEWASLLESVINGELTLDQASDNTL